MSKIVFNITHGFQARMLLRSAITDTLLKRGANLVIISPSYQEQYFQREFNHPQIILEDMPFCASRVEAHLITLRQFLLMNPALGKTLNHKNEALRFHSPWRYWLARFGNQFLGRFPILRHAYMKVEEKIFPGREFDMVLKRHLPKLVVTGTPGFNSSDIHMLRAAKRLGIPTATVMLSWDNLTSKGYMNGIPNSLLVWSDLMAEEAVHYHNYSRERIFWCGAAQFDHYFGIRNRIDRIAWRRENGIPDDVGLIVYGTVNPALLPHELKIIESIIENIESGRIIRPIHLWIRLHPQVVRGEYSQSLEPYRLLARRYSNITVEEPKVNSEKLPWDLPREDVQHLGNLLVASDIVVTTSSTLSIDAACADTPIINLFYDGECNVPPALSVKRFMFYTHYAKLLSTKGIAAAMNSDDFISIVNAYLKDPSLHQLGRAEIIKQQMKCLDGKAGLRTAERLLQLAIS